MPPKYLRVGTETDAVSPINFDAVEPMVQNGAAKGKQEWIEKARDAPL